MIVYTIIALGFGSLTVIYATSLAVWVGAKCFNGQGTLLQTRSAILWTLVWSIPIGFFLLLIYFTIRRPDHGTVALIIRIISYLGALTTFIYGFIVLITTVSETHRFGIWRSLFSVLLGLIMLTTVLFALFKLL